MSTDNDTIDFQLPDEVGIYEVGDLHRELGSVLHTFIDGTGSSTRHALRLGAQRVSMIDTAGLQLLLVLAKELQSRGLELDLVAPTPALLRVIDRLGAGALFGIAPTAQVA